MFDTSGSRLNFTVTSEIAETFRISFWVGKSAYDVTGATFQAAAYTAHGTEQELVAVLPVQHDERAEAILLTVPALDEGHYLWELRATDTEGEETRLLYGTMTALSSASVLASAAATEASELRELAVQQSEGTAAALVLRWQSCTSAAKSAADAAASATAAAASATAAAASATEAATTVSTAAATLQAAVAADAERAEEAATEAADICSTASKVSELWEAKFERAVWCNPETGTWWVYDKDTTCAYRGEDGHSPMISDGKTWLVWDATLAQYVDTLEPVRGDSGRSPYINSAGDWVRWDDEAQEWVDTGTRAAGRDGINGTAVRRILVDSVEDIPTSGETCNGGYYYYVDATIGTKATGWIYFENAPASGDWLTINGVTITMPEGTPVVSEIAALINAAPCGVTAVASDDEPRVTLTAIEAGAAGNSITLSLGDNPSSESISGATLTGGADGRASGYDVYAWLEPVGWTLIGDANDVATAEILGMSKLGTDVTVTQGAPVGHNAARQMMVPPADSATLGSVRASLGETLASGGALGVDSAGRMWAQPCSASRYGAAMPSCSTTVPCECVGLTSGGKLGVAWATLNSPGAIKLGSQFGEAAPLPYLVGVGATSNHELANNLLIGGMLQHMKPAGWVAKGMSWLDESKLDATSYYLGINTSDSFTQTQEDGLVLMGATTEVMGGVKLAVTIASTDTGAATGALVYSYLIGNYYTKAEVYSKAEVDGTFLTIAEAERRYCCFDKKYHEEVLQECKDIAANAKTDCQAIADAMQAEADTLLKKTSNLTALEVMTLEEYRKLGSVSSTTLYFLT